MAAYKIRVGTAEMSADIDEPSRDDWEGTIAGAEALGAGPAVVSILTAGGDVDVTAEAEVIPAEPGKPTTLRGMRAFSSS